jgi:hypothetical protein
VCIILLVYIILISDINIILFDLFIVLLYYIILSYVYHISMIYIHNALFGYVIEKLYAKSKSSFLQRIRIVHYEYYECKSYIIYNILFDDAQTHVLFSLRLQPTGMQ